MAINIEPQEYKTEREIEEGVPMLQVRVNAGSGCLHLQGWSSTFTVNRNYGWASKFTVPPQMTTWLAKHEPTHTSFASSERVYVRGLTVREFTDGIQLHIYTGGEVLGANYNDTTFVLDMNPNKPLVAEMLDFLRGNDLIETFDEVRWTQ
jgi:hypothetical protein